MNPFSPDVPKIRNPLSSLIGGVIDVFNPSTYIKIRKGQKSKATMIHTNKKQECHECGADAVREGLCNRCYDTMMLIKQQRES